MNDVRNRMPATELTGARWVKSSRSTPTGGTCVQVAFLAAFAGGAGAGEFG